MLDAVTVLLDVVLEPVPLPFSMPRTLNQQQNCMQTPLSRMYKVQLHGSNIQGEPNTIAPVGPA